MISDSEQLLNYPFNDTLNFFFFVGGGGVLFPFGITKMKSFIAKQVISILVNLRYLRLKLLKYKENKKICDIFYHNFKNISLYMQLAGYY